MYTVQMPKKESDKLTKKYTNNRSYHASTLQQFRTNKFKNWRKQTRQQGKQELRGM